MYTVQSLETLAKKGEVNVYVRVTIDKLEGQILLRDLVRIDDDWQEWKFLQLVEALRKWTERNTVKTTTEKHVTKHQQYPFKRDRTINTR